MKSRKLIVLLAILVLAGLTYILGYSNLLTVKSVQIIGSQTTLKPDVAIGERLARIEPRVIAQKFEGLSWVENVEVSRNWVQGKVTIKLIERTPIATFNNQVIDANGKSFSVRGAMPIGLINIQAANEIAAGRAVKFLDSLPPEIREGLQVLKVRSSGAFVLEIEDKERKLEIRWGSDSENELKAKVYQALIALPENSQIKRMDLSAPRAPIVK